MTESRVQLADLGWDASWQEALDRAASAQLGPLESEQVPGRVARVDRGVCTVITAAGAVRASLGGSLLDALAADSTAGPCTGDWGLVRQWPDGPLTLETIAARRTFLVRADSSRSSHGQPLAANIDVVAIVVALHPEPNIGRIERLLAVAWESGARPAVVLTKADLVVDADALAEDVGAAAPGLSVICCSTASLQGVDEVRALLAGGRTVALVGASGHGKSSLTNALVGADVLTTRTIRDDGKGRHTSVRRELVVVPGGGAVIDTPGLRGVGLQRDRGSLDAAFPEIEQLTVRCRFRDCRHRVEPGCAVLAAVASGAIPVRRWESWLRLQRDLQRAEARTKARLRVVPGSRRSKLD